MVSTCGSGVRERGHPLIPTLVPRTPYLVHVKVVDDGIKAGVEVVQQRHHLQEAQWGWWQQGVPSPAHGTTAGGEPLAHPQPCSHLHRGALSRERGEAHNVTEVDGDAVESLSSHRLTTLQLLRHRAAEGSRDSGRWGSSPQNTYPPPLPAPLTSTNMGSKQGLLCPHPTAAPSPPCSPQPHAAPLTGAGSGRGGSPLCASPPGRLGFVPPPASPGCWHTAPCVTAGCPGCWCCPPCRDRGSWAMGPWGHPPGGCPRSQAELRPLCPIPQHPLVESADEDLDLAEVRALSGLLRPAALHQHSQLLAVHPDVDGGPEEGLLAVAYLLHNLCPANRGRR